MPVSVPNPTKLYFRQKGSPKDHKIIKNLKNKLHFWILRHKSGFKGKIGIKIGLKLKDMFYR